MRPLPEASSPLRRFFLAPLALGYAAATRLHGAWLAGKGLKSRGGPRARPALPLIVVGSLRAGGAGKTAAVMELARRLGGRGLRVGIVAYRIGKGIGAGREKILEVGPETDWRRASDEAVMLARDGAARVFVTRDRAAAWRLLDATGAFDVLLSDDGLMDPRLEGACRVVLAAAGEAPTWRDLLPAGPFRLTASALRRADLVLRGPPDFRRALIPPPGFDFTKKYWALAGLGNPAAFRRSLEGAGIDVAGLTAGPDHGVPDLARARRDAARAGAQGFVYTAKDGVKLAGLGTEIGESVTFSAAFLSALDAFLAPPSS
jgi:tetraacyldisaccharide-1-P 4'-kinase